MYVSAALKLLVVSILSGSMTGVATAQDPAVKRTILQRMDVPGGWPQECVLGLAEIPPGASIGRHFHHGIEVGLVLKGDLELEIEGAGVRRLKQGESYKIEAGKVHDARNVGPSLARVNGVWVVQKGKPLSEPAD